MIEANLEILMGWVSVIGIVHNRIKLNLIQSTQVIADSDRKFRPTLISIPNTGSGWGRGWYDPPSLIIVIIIY